MLAFFCNGQLLLPKQRRATGFALAVCVCLRRTAAVVCDWLRCTLQVQTLDADGMPIGEGILNPMYSTGSDNELQAQWAGFVAGSKLQAVRSWWEIDNLPQQPLAKVDDIDWNA